MRMGSGHRAPDGALSEHALAALGAALDAVVCVDERGRVVAWNAHATELLGWDDDSRAGRPVWELLAPMGQESQLQVDVARTLSDPGVGPHRVERIVLGSGG